MASRQKRTRGSVARGRRSRFGADEWIVSSFGWMVESLESSICWLWYELLVVAGDWPKKILFRVILMSFLESVI
jgi:hypothetical protein